MMSNCVVNDNHNGNGGGALFAYYASVDISYCDMSSNSAGTGGAVYAEASNIVQHYCNMTSNFAVTGGVYYASSSAIETYNCIIDNNSAYSFCGLYLYATDCIIDSSSVQHNKDIGNSYYGSGSGVYCK